MSVFGAKSTAEEVVEGHDLSGKVMVVTGGNVGIGYETVKALAGAGAHVVMCSRNVEAGKAAVETMQSPEMKVGILKAAAANPPTLELYLFLLEIFNLSQCNH